jgi:hypothetical protein
MKESITKFDLEAAFKALDDIEIPVANTGIKANRPALTEIFSRKSKFDSLMEEYYDIGDMEELDDAKEAREAEVAKAKLARIEKIVDLDADSPEDLLTSYVGKYIMQCPQCMTLFYKNSEDIVESEEDKNTVNVNEVCQHCGNETGYTLIGKVGEAEPDEFEEAPIPEATEEELPEEPTEEDDIESEENSEELEDLGDLEELDLDIEEDGEETQEESFAKHDGESLVEELDSEDKELDAKLDAHNEYIEYLRTAISNEEEKLEKATNEQVKVAIQRNIDAFKADLENALPEAVKNDAAIAEEPVEVETVVKDSEEDSETQEESLDSAANNEVLTESLHEEADVDISAAEFEELISSPEFKKPISDSEARAMMTDEKEAEEKDGTPIKESRTTYQCSECGHEFEHEDENFDRMCPTCKNYHDSAEKLEEGVFDLFKTRAGKADWVLKNAMIDYTKAIVDKNGDAETKKENQKFSIFVVVSYGDTDTTGAKIEKAPNPTDVAKLVPNTKYPEVKTAYADAEKIAKGRSMKSDGGPAFIYLAKDANDGKAEFLCQYFDGKLDEASDRLDTIIETIKKDMKGAKLEVKGGSDQSEIRKVKADAVKPGMKIQLKDKSTAEITAVKAVEDPEGGSMYRISVTSSDGKKFNLDRAMSYEFTVLRDSMTTESLDTIMAGLEDLQESTLETLIADSLVEAYSNVAGFRLTECTFADNKFTIDGTIYFTSGSTRKTTYIFDEHCEVLDNKVSMRGLNEKLGTDKWFTLTGKIDNKTLITESFKCNK